MNGPRWDDEMKFELLRLRSEMRSENFRVLASPMGLGRMTVETRMQDKPLYPRMRAPVPLTPLKHKAAHDKESEVPLTMPSERPIATVPAPSKEAAHASSSSSPSWAHWLLVHLFDLGFVILSLGIGLVVLAWILDPGQMSWHPARLFEALPVQIMQNLKGWTLVVGVYLIFGLYWLFFKLLAGATLGESFLPKFRASEEQVAAAPDNASRET